MSFCFLNCNWIIAWAVVCGISVCAFAQPVEPVLGEGYLSLSECYALALKRSETVAIRKEVIEEAEARFQQSLSGILPRASYVISEEIEQGGNRTPQQRFVFSQALFSGFREFAAMKQSRAERRQRVAEFERAKQILFTDVADAFYLVMNYQEDRQALDATRQALVDRIEELKKRQSIGRTRRSEVVNAEARLSRVEADLQKVDSQKEIAEQLLEFLIGQPFAGLIEQESTENLAPVDEYLDAADQRPDVLAGKESWQGSKSQVTVARSGFWPSANADGNYYTKREGSSEDVDWDVTFSVDVPLFQGGQVAGEVNEAKALMREAELSYSDIRRRAKLDIQNSYTRYTRAVNRLAALKKALQAAEENYKLQEEDYRNSLVNNLDVLQALEDLQQAKREFIAVKYLAKQYYWQLQVSVGKIL